MIDEDIERFLPAASAHVLARLDPAKRDLLSRMCECSDPDPADDSIVAIFLVLVLREARQLAASAHGEAPRDGANGAGEQLPFFEDPRRVDERTDALRDTAFVAGQARHNQLVQELERRKGRMLDDADRRFLHARFARDPELLAARDDRLLAEMGAALDELRALRELIERLHRQDAREDE